jgi:hypothetical protein
MKTFHLAIITSVFLASIFSGQTFADDLGSNAKTKQKWGVADGKLSFASQSGKAGREFTFGEQKKNIQEGSKSGKEIHKITGGSAGDGKYGWVYKEDWKRLPDANSDAKLFQYYGGDGSLLWEKDSVISAIVSNDGQFVFTLEADPDAIATGDAGNTYYYPIIYSSSGAIVDEIDDCVTYQPKWSVSKDGRFATVGCQEVGEYKSYQLIFSLKYKKKFSWTGPGFVNINSVAEDGSFTTHLNQQEKNPATGMYEYKVSTQTTGRLEWK